MKSPQEKSNAAVFVLIWLSSHSYRTGSVTVTRVYYVPSSLHTPVTQLRRSMRPSSGSLLENKGWNQSRWWKRLRRLQQTPLLLIQHPREQWPLSKHKHDQWPPVRKSSQLRSRFPDTLICEFPTSPCVRQPSTSQNGEVLTVRVTD